MRMVGRRQPKSSGKCARIDEGGIGKRCATPPRASETRLTIALHRAMRRVRIIGTRPRAPARADFDFDTPAAREASALT
ncbi:pkhd-type hydroxylase [Burkholderia pseudomallei 305]|nr:pkhd-type hydroxylase [Burkholderia pseudomallei 305]